MVKKPTCNVGNLHLTPGLGRPPGEGNGYLLQYSCLENSTERGACRAIVHGITMRWTPSMHVYIKKNKKKELVFRGQMLP